MAGYVYDASYTATSINGSVIANGANATTAAAISNSAKIGTVMTVKSTAAVNVYVLARLNNTPDYCALTDNPQWPAITVSTSWSFEVLGHIFPDFKVGIVNNSGGSATVTVSYRQFAIG